MTVRVLIADDQAVVRTGLRRILEVDPEIEVAGEAVDGLAAAERILAAGAEPPRVLMLTTFGLDEYVFEALRAGASGFLLKDATPEEILAGVRGVARGDIPLDAAVTRSIVARVSSLPAPRPELGVRMDELTAREREVLMLLARGLSNAEIAGELVVSEGTVKTHVARVLMKLGLRDRVQAVIFAYEAGLVGSSGA